MLLIWDIHLTQKTKDLMFKELKRVSKLDDTLIFLWDYVHSFSYDKPLMFELFDFLLSLPNKKYLMAGNHDWIFNQFVFAEAQRSFSYIDNPPITFITEPTKIDDMYFLPYNIQFKWDSEKTHKGERMSENIATHLNQLDLTDTKYFFFHHYIDWHDYWWGMNFFTKKDVSIDRSFIQDNPDINFFSWHVHQQSKKDNYTCIWSTQACSIADTEDKAVYFLDGKKEKIKTHTHIYFNDKLELLDDCSHKTAIVYTDDVVWYKPPTWKWYYKDVFIRAKRKNNLVSTKDILNNMWEVKIKDRRQILVELIDKKYWDKKEKLNDVLSGLKII